MLYALLLALAIVPLLSSCSNKTEACWLPHIRMINNHAYVEIGEVGTYPGSSICHSPECQNPMHEIKKRNE